MLAIKKSTVRAVKLGDRVPRQYTYRLAPFTRTKKKYTDEHVLRRVIGVSALIEADLRRGSRD
jgi:hypothetical protein